MLKASEQSRGTFWSRGLAKRFKLSSHDVLTIETVPKPFHRETPRILPKQRRHNGVSEKDD